MKIELFRQVIFCKDLWGEIQSHIKGKKYKDWTDGTKAARLGYLNLIKEKHKHSEHMVFTTATMDWAAAYGRLEIVKWLHENRSEGCTPWAMDLSTRAGHFEVTKWLYKNRSEGNINNLMILVRRMGRLEIVKWLQDNVKCYKN